VSLVGSLKVHLEYGEIKVDFEGSPEDVIKFIMEFIAKHYPAYELVRNLTLTVDLEDLLRKLEGIIGFSPEGVVITIPKEKVSKLSIRDQIALHLVKVYVGNQLKKIEKATLSVDELLKAIGGRIGAMAGRLSEMVDENLVERVGRGEYRITTYGLKHFSEAILPKVRQICGVD